MNIVGRGADILENIYQQIQNKKQKKQKSSTKK
jgi:hypothetical protein